MTSIEILSIQGIRSFSPTNKQLINFEKPLTLIVGANGCGKTTIIECLKAATTGELPPNCQKGQYFVNDPKIIGDSEVKAQIRLQFKGSNKKKMLVVRSFQLTQKNKKLEFRQLESAVQTRNEKGDVVSQSYRCSDMDKLVPEMMGVSKSILENVIFCHQEEVNWPLSDSKTLKEKFDDIFSSTRYTKALKSIKDLKKQQNDLIKELQKDVAVLEVHKTQYYRLEKDFETETFKVEQILKNIEEIDQKLSDYEEKIESYDRYADKIKRVHDKLTGSKKEKEILEKTVEEIYNSLEQEFEEDDTEFLSLENDFNQQLKELNSEKGEKENNIKKSSEEKEKYAQEHSKLQGKLGALLENKKSHEHKLVEGTNLIIKASKKCSIPGYENGPFTPIVIEKFYQELDGKVNSFKEKLKRLKSEHKRIDNDLSDTIGNTQSKINSINTILKSNEKKYNELERKSKEIEKELNKDQVSEEYVQKLSHEIKQEELKLNQTIQSYDLDSLSSKINSFQVELKDCNKKISETASLMKEREAEQLASIRIKDMKDQRDQIQNNLDSKIKDSNPSFQKIGIEVDPETVEKKLKYKIIEKESKVNQINKDSQKFEFKISSLNENIKNSKIEIEKNEKLISEMELKIKKEIQSKSLDEFISTAEEQCDSFREDVSMGESLKLCYENFIKLAKSENSCPICERGLDPSQLHKFIDTQQEKLEKAPEHLKKKKTLLKQSEDLLNRLKNLKPIENEIKKLRTQILPELQNKKIKFIKEKEENEKSKEIISKQLEESKQDFESTKKLNDFSQEIIRLNSDLNSLNIKIQKEEKKLNLNSSNEVTYEELLRNNETLRNNVEKLYKDIEICRKEQNEKEKDIQNLKKQFELKKEKYQKSQLELEKKKRYIEQFEKLNLEKKEIQNQNSDEKLKIEPLKEKYEELSIEKKEIREKQEKKENEIQYQIDELQKELNIITNLSKEIKKYEDENKEEQLNLTKEKIEKYKIKIEELNKMNQNFIKSLKETEEKINLQGTVKQNIQDNKKYRLKKKELNDVKKSISKLNEEYQKYTGTSKFDDKEIELIKKKRNKLSNEKSELIGMKTTHNDRIKKIKSELKKDEYTDVEKKHKSTLIKLKTSEMANEDLETYHNALNQALMKYHSMKMSEINEIIKELWQKTYRGSDIDTIEIRADAGTGRASYNYRVVMMKGDVALDMRGRCSAGQKVLACLIIRLALAEAFCLDCGVLALDEPTTNLDSDNIASLAHSIQLIISERRKQSNFQLIVITHDEEFVSKIGRSEYVDSFYRVSKHPETQHSIIEKESFRESN